MMNRKRKTVINLGPDAKVSKKEPSKKSTAVLNIDQFARSRVIEIQALTDLVKEVGGNHQAFQKLPPHMRRRAMSHDIKRVPRRLHNVVKSELDKVKAPNKRPSRKYRRKPSNLLSEYEQRKRRIHWLDTHIWHAKRFKMMETWGYRLPYQPTNKSIRSCYRAVQRHCLLQDVSYEHYIELKGKRENIIKGLCHLTCGKTGPTFAAKMTSTGSREGSLYLFNYDTYPQKVIGRVTYLWRPEKREEDKEDLESCLWIGCHPTFETEALGEIRKCFDDQSHLDKSGEIISDKVIEKDCKVSITSLKHEIVKFRLFGPASNLVLKETLQLWNTNELCMESVQQKILPSKKDNDVSSVEIKENGKGECADQQIWWKSYYQSTNRQNGNEEQKKVWSAVLGRRSPGESPPHLVMAATVRDPRLQLPPKRNKVSVLDADPVGERLQPELFTIEASTSPLWDKDVRHNVKATKIQEKTLNDMKSKHLVPGTILELGEKESRIPVVLIQRPGLTDVGNSSRSWGSSQHQIGYASGWDILIPAGWAMAFWVALVYRGARVGGQREAKSIALQARQLAGVRDVPDSSAGKKELETEAVTLQTKHDRRPPAKRPNYTKLGFDFPFVFPFDQLCKEWMKKFKKLTVTTVLEDSKMHVLRDRRILKMLNMVLTDPKYFVQNQKSKDKTQNSSSKSKQMSVFEKFLSTEEGKELAENHGDAMLPVAVTVLQRGVPASHAHICIPSKEDLEKIKKMKNYGGPDENLHPDEDAPRRKAERKERLRSRKKRNNKAGKIKPKQFDMRDNEGKDNTSQEVNHVQEECGKAYDFFNKTSRSIIGLVSTGDFDLGQGQGSGIGFCSVVGVLQLIEAWQTGRSNEGGCLALVRNPTSLQYRFVSISVIL